MNAHVLLEIVEFFFPVCQSIAYSSQNWVPNNCKVCSNWLVFLKYLDIKLMYLFYIYEVNSCGALGHSLHWNTFHFFLTEKCLLLHMGIHKPFISFLLCTWKWSNNGVFCCNYLPFTFVNCNFCLFWNENLLVWSLEKHLRLWTVSHEQIIFWCK